MVTKSSPFSTEGYKKAHKSVMAASQEVVKLINTVDYNSENRSHRDKMLAEEVEKLREARAQVDHAISLLAHANQLHYMRMIR